MSAYNVDEIDAWQLISPGVVIQNVSLSPFKLLTKEMEKTGWEFTKLFKQIINILLNFGP